MNKSISLNVSGFKFNGEINSSKVSFSFDIFDIEHVASGQMFASLADVRDDEAFVLPETDEQIARLAAENVGIPMDDLLEMDWKDLE